MTSLETIVVDSIRTAWREAAEGLTVGVIARFQSHTRDRRRP